MNYETLEYKVTEWAKGQDEVQALLASITLMNRLGRETAAQWHFLYPGATELRIRERIEVLLPLEKAI